MTSPSHAGPTRPPWSIRLAAFGSSVDRFALSPLLIFLALDFGVSLATAVAVASVYYLCYGASQPFWGMLSDRWGRVQVIRLALVGATAGGVLSACAPSLVILTVLRGLTGAFWGAVVPASITYVGDTVAARHRQSALSDLMAAIALGTAAATAVSGFVGEVTSWRLMFGLPALLALGCLVTVWKLDEPVRDRSGSLWEGLKAVLSSRWAVTIFCFAFTEGALVLGMLTLLAPALQDVGVDPSLAGLTVAGYGVATLGASRLVRPLANRFNIAVLMSIGATTMVLSFVCLILSISVLSVLISSILFGVTWAFLHTSLQTWVTEVLPAFRGTAVAFFAGSLFFGSSVGVILAGPWVDTSQWQILFAGTAVIAVIMAVLVPWARRRYDLHQ